MSTLFADGERFGEAPALIVAATGHTVTHAELHARADAWLASVADAPGLVFLEADNHVEAMVVYVACLRGQRPVFLAAPGALARLDHLVEAYAPAVVVRSVEGRAVTESTGEPGPEAHDDLAVLLSTSGSTGSPKLVRLSHANVKSNSDSIAEYLDLKEGERAITALKPNYSYGMSIVNSHLDNGHALVLTDHSVTDDAFWAALEGHHVTSLAGVPFTYETIESLGIDLSQFEHLRYVTQAGGKLHQRLVKQLAQQLSTAGKRFFVMYGQTEAAPRISYLPPDVAASHPTCIGVAVPGGTIRLLDDNGQVIDRPDTPGVLVYEGPNVMMGYATSSADLAKPPGERRLVTGDIAAHTPAGLFYIVGRAKRFIKPFGVRVNLDDVEQRLKSLHPLAVATGTDESLLLVLPADASNIQAQARAQAVDDLNLPAHVVSVVVVDEIPRLSAGKTDYQALLEQHGPRPDARPTWKRFVQYFIEEVADLLGLRERAWTSVAELYRVLIGVPEVKPDHTFTDLGDSMSYVQVRVELEQLLGGMPPGWEQRTVAELESMRSAGAL